MTARFSSDMTYVLGFSKEEAERLHSDCVTPVHLLLGLLRQKNNKAQDLLRQMRTNLSLLKSELERIACAHQSIMKTNDTDLNFDAESSRTLRICLLEAKLMKSDVIDTEHMLLAILKMGDGDACFTLQKMDINYEGLSNSIKEKIDIPTTNSYDETEYANNEEEEEEEVFGGTTTSSQAKKTESVNVHAKTPVLDNFSTDLTKAAEEGLLDPVVGRDKEIERVAQILCRRKKNNPVLIGYPGVGKSAIVEGLAQRIIDHHICHALWNKRIVVLDMANVVAGTKYRGQFEERIRSILMELQKNPDIIVFIDEIHTLIGAGNASGSMDAANMMKPALARGQIQCVGATTLDEYHKSIEKDGALERRFQKVLVDPASPEETLQILTQLKSRYEEHHHVRYTDEALQACVRLTGRYVTDRYFPDKAIDALDEAGSRIHIQDIPVSKAIQKLEKHISELKTKKNEAVKRQNFELAADYRDQLKEAENTLQEEKKAWEEKHADTIETVNEAQIAEVVSMMTGIPVQRIGQEEHARLLHLNDSLKQKVIGQDDAITTLVKAIQRGRVGLKDPHRPIGTFLFVGPTGVGKTYLTKCLSEELFGSAENIIRIDMSEYMEKHTVSRMVGAPPGYVGFEEGGQLTERVRRKPYSIVLFDEIEKAHPDVFNILLQVMDEGQLTDGNGTTIDFKNTVLIMTSNCGSRQVKEFGQGVGFAKATDAANDKRLAHDLVKKAIHKQFAPEFLNRLDNIIYFDQLDQDAIRRIVDIELKPLIKRVADIGYTMEVSDEARMLLGRKGYDVQFGARPLKRAIQEHIEDALCDLIINGAKKGSTISVNVSAENKDKIEVNVK